MFLVIDCLSEAAGGGWVGGFGQQWAGGQQRVEGGEGNRGGSTVGVSSTSKNRPSQPKNKSPKQFELKGSKSS